MHRVRRFGVIQTANMAAVMYFVMCIIVFLPFVFFASMLPNDGGSDFNMFSGAFLFFVPPIYAVIGWVVTAIACWFYNLIAGFVGGVAVELEAEG